jgi:hypothetical protein
MIYLSLGHEDRMQKKVSVVSFSTASMLTFWFFYDAKLGYSIVPGRREQHGGRKGGVIVRRA